MALCKVEEETMRMAAKEKAKLLPCHLEGTVSTLADAWPMKGSPKSARTEVAMAMLRLVRIIFGCVRQVRETLTSGCTWIVCQWYLRRCITLITSAHHLGSSPVAHKVCRRWFALQIANKRLSSQGLASQSSVGAFPSTLFSTFEL